VKRDLIEQQSGKFEPQKMPNECARAVHELVQAKIEQRAPEVERKRPKAKRRLSMDASRGMASQARLHVIQPMSIGTGRGSPARYRLQLREAVLIQINTLSTCRSVTGQMNLSGL
jgi:hypothetical protein